MSFLPAYFQNLQKQKNIPLNETWQVCGLAEVWSI
jgi:hypothetical protein